MSARDDLRPGTPSLLFEEAGPERSTRSERDREADTARACEALGIPVALPVPPQSPRADKEPRSAARSANTVEMLWSAGETITAAFVSSPDAA